MLSKPVCVCACDGVFECVRVSTEELTRWVCFPSVLVNRSRAAFMCWAHYHGNGCDGNLAAAQVWQATVCCHEPHISTFSPQYMLFFVWLWYCLVGCSGLTCPHSSSPTPMKMHHNHWSSVRAVQENGFPPNWTMMIWEGEGTHRLAESWRINLSINKSHVPTQINNELIYSYCLCIQSLMYVIPLCR